MPSFFYCQSASMFWKTIRLFIIGCAGTVIPLLGQSTQPVEKFTFGGICVGPAVGNESSVGSLKMPEVIRLDSGVYRLFYGKSLPGNDSIKYADSLDGVVWTSGGVVLQGSSNPTDRTYGIGGPSVVRLPDGRYRMYYGAEEKVTGNAPLSHMRSAISTDALHFTAEPGVRIEIAAYDPSSFVSFAGHGTVFRIHDGSYVAIFSGDPVRNHIAGSDLVLATSPDGLTWSNLRVLYPDFHDPIVIPKGDRYYLYAMYMAEYFAVATSADGLIWPSSMDRIEFTDTQGVSLGGDIIGDLGGALDPNGEIRLYSNYGQSGGASTDIAYFRKLNASTGLLLNNNRFEVTVSWKSYSDGSTGQGTPVKLTNESGCFWFFNAGNIELLIKVLDGRSINGYYGVMYGALSDVEYTIRGRDLQTGPVKSYLNPAHTLASSADVRAFAASASTKNLKK